MPLDFGWTCGTIDEAKTECVAEFATTFKDFWNEFIIKEPTATECESYAEYLWRDVDTYFEKVRATNIEMRKEADRQFDKLEDERDRFEEERNDLTDLVQKLEEKINELEDHVEGLQIQLDAFNDQ